MLLFRTVCSTDNKNRPSHNLVFLAKSDNQAEIVEAMNKDVALWMANDIAVGMYNQLEEEVEDDWDLKQVAKLLATKTRDEIKAMWLEDCKDDDRRFEMCLDSKTHREFVEVFTSVGYTCTTVYHLLDDDYKYSISLDRLV